MPFFGIEVGGCPKNSPHLAHLCMYVCKIILLKQFSNTVHNFLHLSSISLPQQSPRRSRNLDATSSVYPNSSHLRPKKHLKTLLETCLTKQKKSEKMQVHHFFIILTLASFLPNPVLASKASKKLKAQLQNSVFSNFKGKCSLSFFVPFLASKQVLNYRGACVLLWKSKRCL